MTNTNFRNLIGLCLVLGLLFPAQVACPQTGAQNAIAAAAGGVSKTKPATPAAAGQAEGKSDEERVKIESADKMAYDPDTKTYHLTGNVVFSNKDSRLYCDQADYNEEADTAKATGHLRATDPSSVITGDLMEADFGKKLTVVTGNVTIVTQKKKNKTSDETAATSLSKADKGTPGLQKAQGNTASGETAASAPKDKSSKEPSTGKDYQEKKTTITCERLEYYYADDVKKMIATPRIKAIQEDKTVWADQAVYEDIPRLITLTGNVVLNTEKGDEMHCTSAVISVDDNWVKAENISGVTLRKNKNEPTKPAAKPAETPAEKPAAGGAATVEPKPKPEPATTAAPPVTDATP